MGESELIFGSARCWIDTPDATKPVCGLLRREGRTTLYVQREVAGIYSPSQDCCNKPRTRLEAVDVTRLLASAERDRVARPRILEPAVLSE